MAGKKDETTPSGPVTVHFAFEKETPGTYRFLEVDAAGAKVDGPATKIGQQYIKKSAFPTKPAKLTFVITAE